MGPGLCTLYIFWMTFLLEKLEISVVTWSMGGSKYVSSPDGLESDNINRGSPSSPNNQPRCCLAASESMRA